jgi:transcription antitermination factor NusG
LATHKPVIINELFGELVIPPEGQRWTVVRTKPRREKKLADYAARSLIQYYLPQIKHKRKYQRRKVVTTVPMFPGYIFMVLSAEERQTIAITGMAAQFIYVNLQEELLDDLSHLFGATQKKVPMENVMWLSKGLEVEITSGALKGTRGIIESHDKISEVRLQVDILRQAVMVKIDPKDVKIIGEYEVVEED